MDFGTLGNITVINPCTGRWRFLLRMLLISYCTSKCLPETIASCLGPILLSFVQYESWRLIAILQTGCGLLSEGQRQPIDASNTDLEGLSLVVPKKTVSKQLLSCLRCWRQRMGPSCWLESKAPSCWLESKYSPMLRQAEPVEPSSVGALCTCPTNTPQEESTHPRDRSPYV